MDRENHYLPRAVEIKEIKKEAPDVKTIVLDLKPEHMPGQFLELSCFGYGEVPISVSGSPFWDHVELSIKEVGAVTEIVHEAREGDHLGVRGPYGKGFPVEKLENNDLILVGGGIGLAPLRSLIEYIRENRSNFRQVHLFYGARSPKDLVFRDQYEKWEKDLDLHLTIDKEAKGWDGEVGFVNSLLKKTEFDLDLEKANAVVCGPGIMMRFVSQDLLDLGLCPENIYMSFERRMKCGIGKCGHCNIGDKLVCIDGPVFSYREIGDEPEVWG